MHKILMSIIFSTLIISGLIYIEISQAADAKMIFIDDDYTEMVKGWNVNHFSSILKALNASENGDTLFVYNGIYYEHVIIDKSIVLIGEDKNDTIIDGKGNGNTVVINADNVFINGFTIRNSGIESNNSGIQILANSTMINNTIFADNCIGILLRSCSNNQITRNIIRGNLYGIGVEFGSIQNKFFENIIFNNTYTGIYLSYCDDNLIFNNSILKNSYGIALSYSYNNYIYHNILNENIVDGLNIFFCNETSILKNIINESECGMKFSSSNSNIVNNNHISYNDFSGISLILGSSSNVIENNVISNNDDGIQVSSYSLENIIKNNIFSSNNQKIVDKTITPNQNTPGFEFIYVVLILIILFYKKENTR